MTTKTPHPMHKQPFIFRDKAFWGMVALGVAYFSPPFLFGKNFFFRDLYLHFFFRKHLLAEFLRSGQLPLWNEFLHGGRPYWGDLSNAVLHPSNLLYAFLSPTTAFNLIIVAHFLLAGAAMYIFARSLGLQPAASFVAGVSFEFCGYTLSLGNMLGFLLALPYLPLLFLGWHRFLLYARRRWLLLALLCGMIQVLAGAPELCVLSLMLLLGWTISFPYARFSRLQRMAFWLGFGVCLLGLTAIQLLPTLEMIAYSSRGTGLPYQSFTQWSLHPKQLAEFIFPGFPGFLDQFPWSVFYWGQHLVDLQSPYIISLYFGAITLVLAIGAPLGAPTSLSAKPPIKNALPAPVRHVLLILSFGSLLLAFGRFLPGFRFLYNSIPLLTLFRYPVKFLMVAIFPMALLAAATVDEVFSADGRARISRHFTLAAAALAIMLLTFAALFRFSDTFAMAIITGWFGDVKAEIARHDLDQTFLHTAVLWTAFTLLLQSVRRNFRAWQPWALAALVTCDLLIAGLRVNPHAPADFFSAVPDVVPLIQQTRGEGRLYRTKNPDKIELPNLPSSDIFWGDRWNLETLNSALAAIYAIPLVFHVDYDRLAHDHIATLDELLDALPWERRLPILSAGNVTTMLTTDRLNLPGVELIGPIPNRSTTPFYLYRNSAALGRQAFVARWQPAASDAEALNALLAPDYDPRQRVILQEPFAHSWMAAVTRKPNPSVESLRVVSRPVDPTALRGTDCQTAAIITISRVLTAEEFAVTNACDGYLVFSVPWYPGWHVTVDDVRTPIVRANYAFSAVFLTAGEHRVERRYVPVSVLVGGGISLIFCGLVAVAMFRIKKT